MRTEMTTLLLAVICPCWWRHRLRIVSVVFAGIVAGVATCRYSSSLLASSKTFVIFPSNNAGVLVICCSEAYALTCSGGLMLWYVGVRVLGALHMWFRESHAIAVAVQLQMLCACLSC